MREIVMPTFFSMSQPLSRTLEQLAEAGVRLVEVHGDAPDRHIDLTDEAAVDALGQVVDGLPIEVHSVHCAFSQPSEDAWDISQPDEAKRATALCDRAKVIGAAGRLGARHVTLHAGVRQRGEDRLARSREGLARLADVAGEARTMIAVENLQPDELGGSVAEVEWLLQDLDPAVAGFCLDTGHAMLGDESLGDYIRALGDRMIGIHWHGNDGSDDAHLFPEAGQAEWDEFLAALDEVGYDLPVTLEAVPTITTSLEDALRPVRALLQGKPTPRLA